MIGGVGDFCGGASEGLFACAGRSVGADGLVSVVEGTLSLLLVITVDISFFGFCFR